MKTAATVIWVILIGIVLPCTGTAAILSGTVSDAGGPISGAIVRIRATDTVTLTDAQGQFSLEADSAGQEVEVTAWSYGHYIAYQLVTPPAGSIGLTLRPYHTTDNADYTWGSPFSSGHTMGCGACHPMIVSQWQANAHGQAISNSRFFSLYNGTDVNGQMIGPGYLNDFPETNGNCANCHAPGAGVDGYLTVNMNDVRGDVTAGIHCDFCHKIGDVYTQPATQSVYANAPGVQSIRVLRPPEGDNIFFGPFDDIHDPDTYLPLVTESRFCAPCHQFSFWGTPIYESYDEWLNSDYAEDGITCQDCHMPPNGDTRFATVEAGGLEHPPEKIPSHLQLGASSTDLLRRTVQLRLNLRWIGNEIKALVAITNSGAGHHVPTDFPGRQMILVVNATAEDGSQLASTGDTVIPSWGGDLAGKPGKAYAKVLKDVITQESPVVTYWKQALIESDNRLAAKATDVSSYAFSAPARGTRVTVTARVVFRRLFADMMVQKGWETPDILMEQRTLSLITWP